MDNSNEPKDQKPTEAPKDKPIEVKPHTPQPRYVVSHVFPDGTIADMIYSQQLEAVAFAVAKGDDISLHAELFVGRDGNMAASAENAPTVLMPSLAVRDLIRENFVYVASNVAEYGTPSDLHNEIRTFIKKYVMLEDDRFYDVATGYVLMSWVFDKFNTLPYLRVIGEMGTGKSRVLDTVGKLCNRAMIASGSISMASIYRTINEVQGSLVFDEANFASSDMSAEIIKILNGGHKKNTPVIRMDVKPTGIKTVTFKVFGPKVLASREAFTDLALESRCITARLYPMNEVSVDVHLPESFDADAQVLRNKLLMFRLRNYHHVRQDVSTLGNLKFPRLRQSALALTSVVKMVSDETLKSVLGFLDDYELDIFASMSSDVRVDVLLCIARLVEFDATVRESGILHMGRIAEEFNARFYDDYKERETKELNTREGPLVIRGQEVSPKKIGGYVSKLQLAKERDAVGFYIPLAKEANKINRLVRYYQLEAILEKQRVKRGVPRSEVHDDFKEDGPDPLQK